MHETMQKRHKTSAMVKDIHLAHVCIEQKQWKSTVEKHVKHVLCEQPHNIKCFLNIEVYSK